MSAFRKADLSLALVAYHPEKKPLATSTATVIPTANDIQTPTFIHLVPACLLSQVIIILS
jgi:hypothetical protein